MTAEAFRCADASLARAEPLHGTASFVRRWMLLEQPGAWGSDALSQSRLPARVAKELRRRASAAGVRVVLIRRGARLSTGRRQCYFLRTEDGATYAGHMSLDAAEDVLDVDLTDLRTGGVVPDAAPLRQPVFLVCTHGRHDACCSIKGNQVSRIACAESGIDAWECSHIGGDRFAANLVCFPHGIYYGRVTPDNVVELMSAYARGDISLDHYRGRCCYRFAIQAAEYFLRRQTNLVGVDDVTFSDSSVTDGRVTASFLAGGRAAEIEIRVTDGPAHHLTCEAARSLPVPRYDLVSVTMS